MTSQYESPFTLNLDSPSFESCWKYLEQGKYEGALMHSGNIIALHPEAPEGWIFKARALSHLKRYEEAEEAFMKVMKLALVNDKLKSDVDGLIKIRDELANVRVEILRKYHGSESVDIAEMHWSNVNSTIKELVGIGSPKNNTNNKEQVDDIDVDCVIVETPKRSEFMSRFKSTSSSSPLTSKESNDSSSRGNLSLSSLFPSRSSKLFTGQADVDQRLNENEAEELKLKTAGFQTSYLLAEEKNKKLMEKVAKLEEELKSVYEQVIKQNQVVQETKKRNNTLKNELAKSYKELEYLKSHFKSYSTEQTRKIKERALKTVRQSAITNPENEQQMKQLRNLQRNETVMKYRDALLARENGREQMLQRPLVAQRPPGPPPPPQSSPGRSYEAEFDVKRVGQLGPQFNRRPPHDLTPQTPINQSYSYPIQSSYYTF